MKYLKLFKSLNKSLNIDELCKKYNIKNYTINTDGSIDVDGYVNLFKAGLKKLPLKFNKINRGFSCSFNKLTSFEGSPVEVNGSSYFNNNKLTSFKGSPKIVRTDFECEYNKINSFEYFPSHVGSTFYCVGNPIYKIWALFRDTKKIELLNDFDMFRDEDTDEPAIIMDRLNDFLLTIGEKEVEKVYGYINI